jgi:hypothetical protein
MGGATHTNQPNLGDQLLYSVFIYAIRIYTCIHIRIYNIFIYVYISTYVSPHIFTLTNVCNLGYNIHYLPEPLIYNCNASTPTNEIITVLSRKKIKV